MLTTTTLLSGFHRDALRSLCCPVCLGDFRVSAPESSSPLECVGCASQFPVIDGLPVLLVEDDNWRRKRDEIKGEVAFNTEIPAQVHEERNAFVDDNTAELLEAAEVDLSSGSALIVGCSMAELAFFHSRTSRVSCLDIVPALALACLRATRLRSLSASWVCGDGEALPFESDAFDAVIVRQALHHMLDYGAAVSECLRVCRRGGTFLVIDEPFAPADPASGPLANARDAERLYGDVTVGDARQALGLSSPSPSDLESPAAHEFRARDGYIEPSEGDAESLLADKYSALSLDGLLWALRAETDDVRAFWPRRVARLEGSGSSLRFGSDSNPQRDLPLLRRLLEGGNVSVVARKVRPVVRARNRAGLRAASLDETSALATNGR